MMKKPASRLVLSKETLRKLSEVQLNEVAGGGRTTVCPVITVDCTPRCSAFDC